jgi:DHA1 family tetracycline resistance protein-like MFS transporter
MIDAIGIGIVFPIMPDLMARVGRGRSGAGVDLGRRPDGGLCGAQFLFAPVVGSLSDAFGRRPVLLVALALAGGRLRHHGAGRTLWLLIVGPHARGVAGATYITATAYIADISAPRERAARFGLIGAAFGIGFVIGPGAGGTCGHLARLGAVLAGGGVVGAELRVRSLSCRSR